MERPLHGGNLTWAAAVADCHAAKIVDFSASINPLGPPATAIAAIQSHLSQLKTYPDPDYRQLRSALSQVHLISPDWILPGNGSAELLNWVGWDLSQLEITYLLTPAFGDYWRCLKAFGAKVKKYPLNIANLGQEQKKLILSSQDKSVITPALPISVSDFPLVNSRYGLLLNNPHNPTGQLFSREAILPYLEKFALVVVDEAFMDFLPPENQESLIDLVPQFPNLMILRSLTKFYSLPGLRLGYAIAHPDRLRRWQQLRDPWPVNGLAAAVGEVVVFDIDFAKKTWDWLLSSRPELFSSLANLPKLQPLPGAANYLLVHSEIPSFELQEKLLKQQQILIRDCSSFPELGDRFFRVAIRTPEDNQRLIAGLTDIIV